MSPHCERKEWIKRNSGRNGEKTTFVDGFRCDDSGDKRAVVNTTSGQFLLTIGTHGDAENEQSMAPPFPRLTVPSEMRGAIHICCGGSGFFI